jgi:hypothetical protein
MVPKGKGTILEAKSPIPKTDDANEGEAVIPQTHGAIRPGP